MSAKIGIVADGNNYPGNVGVTPAKAAENVKVDSQNANANAIVENTARNSKLAVNSQETLTEELKKDELKREELEKATEELSKVVQPMGTNLTFSVHETTQRLMVRMVDLDNGTILKEFPPKEFLDMVSRIKDYVGNLLDKKV